jgi:6,7-dimethyl-8-ribityllumazine synthase
MAEPIRPVFIVANRGILVSLQTATDVRGRIAFIQSSWHKEIVDQSRDAFLTALNAAGIESSRVDLYAVPGAFEIPLHAKLLAKMGKYVAIVAAGLVVDGGIYRHDFVAQAVISGLMQVQLESEIPVFSAVLTPHHFHEHAEHQQFFSQHFLVKGREVAQACIGTLRQLQVLKY